MGTFIDGLWYADDEYIAGPDGRPVAKVRKVLGLPPSLPVDPVVPAREADAAAASAAGVTPPGPASDRQTATPPAEYRTKIIEAAAPEGPALQTKGDAGGESDNTGADASAGASAGGGAAEGGQAEGRPAGRPRGGAGGR